MSRIVVGELGWCVVKMTIHDNGVAEGLTILSPAGTNQDRYVPAESVCVFGRNSLLKLQAFLDQHLTATEVKP